MVAPTMGKKLNAGYAHSFIPAHAFNITPAVGLYPIKGNKKFAVEASFFMNFGSVSHITDSSSIDKTKWQAGVHEDANGAIQEMEKSTMISNLMPVISAQYVFNPDAKFSVMVGGGFGIPIQKTKQIAGELIGTTILNEKNVGFAVVLNGGVMWNIWKNLSIIGELTAGMGSFYGWSLDAGVRYTFN